MRNLASGPLMAWLALAMPLWASQQSMPDTAAGQIVVTGERTPEEVVRDFVRGIAEEASGDQLARWEDPICPQVIGFLDEQNAYVEETITAVAVAVGAEAGAEGCYANLFVVVADNPGEVIQAMRLRQPALFRSINPPERRRLVESDSVARMWSMLVTRGSDGRPTQRQEFGSGGLGPAAGLGVPDTEYLFGVQPSRITLSTRVDLAANFILLDGNRIEGIDLNQLSGFVAMLALAQIDIDDPVRPERSILNLFHRSEDRPADLSDWDIAYLCALYASDNRPSATAQRGQMMRIMRETLIQETDQ